MFTGKNRHSVLMALTLREWCLLSCSIISSDMMSVRLQRSRGCNNRKQQASWRNEDTTLPNRVLIPLSSHLIPRTFTDIPLFITSSFKDIYACNIDVNSTCRVFSFCLILPWPLKHMLSIFQHKIQKYNIVSVICKLKSCSTKSILAPKSIRSA